MERLDDSGAVLGSFLLAVLHYSEDAVRKILFKIPINHSVYDIKIFSNEKVGIEMTLYLTGESNFEIRRLASIRH